MAPGGRSASYLVAAAICRPLLRLLTRPHWDGLDHLPRSGGVVVCPNHVSHLDPFVVAHPLHELGRPPRFLAKASVFDLPLVGPLLRGAGQIPVHRETGRAGDALGAAVAAVRSGECVVVYPEGTLTRDPGLWPMTGKTGAVRIAQAAGCPLIPVAQWGTQRVLPPYVRRPRLRLRAPVAVRFGPPVDLSGSQDPTVQTERVMSAITRELGRLRATAPPARRWDPRSHRAPRIGNPRGPGGGVSRSQQQASGRRGYDER